MGARSIFIMDGIDVENKCVATRLLTINLPKGKKFVSTHVCDIHILGLPTDLMGHIVLSFTIVSLIGICPQCKAGCKVVFDNDKCDMMYNDKIILTGYKDSITDLWTLPIHTKVCTTPGSTVQPRPGPCLGRTPNPSSVASDTHPGLSFAAFMYSVCTWANAVKFAHQFLCNPKISTLLKAVRRGLLKGSPNMTEKLILKYLNPSPATAKGHMKCPYHEIWSTEPKLPMSNQVFPFPGAPMVPLVIPQLDAVPVFPGPAYEARLEPNLIAMDDDKLITNNFCIGAFAKK